MPARLVAPADWNRVKQIMRRQGDPLPGQAPLVSAAPEHLLAQSVNLPPLALHLGEQTPSGGGAKQARGARRLRRGGSDLYRVPDKGADAPPAAPAVAGVRART